MYLVYAGLTILIEIPVFLLFWRNEGWWQSILFCILLNGFTNPLLNFAIETWHADVYLLELGVVLLEMLAAMLVFSAKFVKSLAFSVSANALSYFSGVLMFEWGWL